MPTRGEALVSEWIGYFEVVAGSYAIPSRFDSDDCVQECFVELSALIQDVDPTDPDFPALLKTRIFRRLVDINRAQRCSVRDVSQSVRLSEEAVLSDVGDPADIACANDLEEAISVRLSHQQQSVWNELIHPGPALRVAFEQHRKRCGKCCHEVPVVVYSQVTGLSIRQVRYALDRIRFISRQLFSSSKEGRRYAGSVT